MNNSENKDKIKQYYNWFNKGGEIPFEDYFSPDFFDHSGYPNQVRGPEGVREGYKTWIKAFPDHRAEIADIVSENDRVVVRTIATGTHEGEFMGIPSTGKKIRVEGISIFRMDTGLICERWGLIEGEKLIKFLQED